MAITMSPGSANALQALNMLLQQQSERKRSKQEMALSLLGLKIRQDEAMKDRLFTESREVKRDLSIALDNFEKAEKDYTDMGGKITELNEKLFKDKHPTLGFSQVMGSLSNMHEKNLQYSQKTIADAYQEMLTLNEAYRDIQNEIGTVKNFAVEIGLREFDKARLMDIEDKRLQKGRKADDLSPFYHRAYVTDAEAQATFDWMEGKGIELDSAQRGALISEWRELSDKRYAQLLQEEHLRLAGQPRGGSVKEWKPDYSEIRQLGEQINMFHSGLEWKGMESSKVVTPNVNDSNLVGIEQTTMDNISHTLERGADKGWIREFIPFISNYGNLPKAIDENVLKQYREAKNPEELRSASAQIADQIVKADLTKLDFSGRGGKERDKQLYLLRLVDYYQKVKSMQDDIDTYNEMFHGIEPKRK